MASRNEICRTSLVAGPEGTPPSKPFCCTDGGITGLGLEGGGKEEDDGEMGGEEDVPTDDCENAAPENETDRSTKNKIGAANTLKDGMCVSNARQGENRTPQRLGF